MCLVIICRHMVGRDVGWAVGYHESAQASGQPEKRHDGRRDTSMHKAPTSKYLVRIDCPPLIRLPVAHHLKTYQSLCSLVFYFTLCVGIGIMSFYLSFVSY